VNWTKRMTIALLAAVAFTAPAWAQTPDVKGSKDHPLVTRMPGFYIRQYDEKEFDSARCMSRTRASPSRAESTTSVTP